MSFYRNFSSKDDVIDAYIDIILYKYTESLFENEIYSFLKMLDTIFILCDKYNLSHFWFLVRDTGNLLL